MVYSMRRFVLSLALCYFVFVFFSPFSIAITSLEEELRGFSFDLRLFGFVFVLFLFGVWEGLWLGAVALP